MPDEIRALISEGRYEDAVARCSELLERVDVQAARPEWAPSFFEVLEHAVALGRAGARDAALRVLSLMKSKMLPAPDRRIRMALAPVFVLEGEIHHARGEEMDAIAAFDEALQLLPSGAPALVEKARALDALGRREEAIVASDTALSLIGAAGEPATDRARTRRAKLAARATFQKLSSYLELGRYEQTLELGPALSAALADLPAAHEAAGGPEADMLPVAESALAAAVAEIVNVGQCWLVFEGEQKIAPEDAARRALQLYRASEPWAWPISDTEEPDPVDMATGMVHDIADGYAMLARPDAEHARLPLPQRYETERQRQLRDAGVDVWARDHGHPLLLHPTHEDPPRPSSPTGEQTDREATESSFVRDTVGLLCLVEIVAVLSSSAAGQEVLKAKLLKPMVFTYLPVIRVWINRLVRCDLADPRAAIMCGFLLYVRALFTGSYEPSAHPTAALTNTAWLRDYLHQSGGYDWLISHDVPLPAWIE